MITETTVTSIEALAQNKEFIEKAKATKTTEELTEVLNEYGVEITAEDLQQVADAMANGELSEEDMDGVAGGRRMGEVEKAVRNILAAGHGIAMVGINIASYKLTGYAPGNKLPHAPIYK